MDATQRAERIKEITRLLVTPLDKECLAFLRIELRALEVFNAPLGRPPTPEDPTERIAEIERDLVTCDTTSQQRIDIQIELQALRSIEEPTDQEPTPATIQRAHRIAEITTLLASPRDEGAAALLRCELRGLNYQDTQGAGRPQLEAVETQAREVSTASHQTMRGPDPRPETSSGPRMGQDGPEASTPGLTSHEASDPSDAVSDPPNFPTPDTIKTERVARIETLEARLERGHLRTESRHRIITELSVLRFKEREGVLGPETLRSSTHSPADFADHPDCPYCVENFGPHVPTPEYVATHQPELEPEPVNVLRELESGEIEEGGASQVEIDMAYATISIREAALDEMYEGEQKYQRRITELSDELEDLREAFKPAFEQYAAEFPEDEHAEEESYFVVVLTQAVYDMQSDAVQMLREEAQLLRQKKKIEQLQKDLSAEQEKFRLAGNEITVWRDRAQGKSQ